MYPLWSVPACLCKFFDNRSTLPVTVMMFICTEQLFLWVSPVMHDTPPIVPHCSARLLSPEVDLNAPLCQDLNVFIATTAINI